MDTYSRLTTRDLSEFEYGINSNTNRISNLYYTMRIFSHYDENGEPVFRRVRNSAPHIPCDLELLKSSFVAIIRLSDIIIDQLRRQ